MHSNITKTFSTSGISTSQVSYKMNKFLKTVTYLSRNPRFRPPLPPRTLRSDCLIFGSFVSVWMGTLSCSRLGSRTWPPGFAFWRPTQHPPRHLNRWYHPQGWPRGYASLRPRQRHQHRQHHQHHLHQLHHQLHRQRLSHHQHCLQQCWHCRLTQRRMMKHWQGYSLLKVPSPQKFQPGMEQQSYRTLGCAPSARSGCAPRSHWLRGWA